MMKTRIFALGLGALLSFVAVGEEKGVQRLENAQKGMAEGSWPRKPDNRISPLSGKMKESRELSVRHFGQEREVPMRAADGWKKEAAVGHRPGWAGSSEARWEGARWDQGRDWTSAGVPNEEFQPEQELAKKRTPSHRELRQESAAGWASRSARMGVGRDGTVRMYEGKLTRVRDQVWRGPENVRDLGVDRQEQFTPEEVERILSRPLGPERVPREQSPAASPLAAAGS